MSQGTIGVFIPYLANVRKVKPFGCFRKLKKYVSKAFAKPDKSGKMVLGVVKKVELVIKKQNEVACSSGKMTDDKNDKYLNVSAYIRFVPSGSKATQKLLDEINSDNGCRFIHNEITEVFWIIHRQKKDKDKEKECEKDKEKEEKISDIKHNCPMCGGETERDLSADYAEEIADMFDRMSCNDGPAKKRVKRS